MSKTPTPPKFFVGKIKTATGKVRFQVMRQRVTGRLVKKTVVEVFGQKWTPVKTRFVRASKLTESRNQARRDKAEQVRKIPQAKFPPAA